MALGIEGWDPELLGTSEDLVSRHVLALRELVGASLDAVHVLDGPDGWLPDAPVVLSLAGRRLEICAWQLDLSLTWDVIDLDRPAYPTDDRHDWRPADHPAVLAVLGRPVESIDVVENSFSVTRRETGEVVEGWLLSGLRLTVAGVPLVVYNALDQNGLAGAEGLDGVRYRPLT